MKLSEKLKKDHECGDFGKALQGYAEIAERLEFAAYGYYYNIVFDIYGSTDEATTYADHLMERLDSD